MRKYILQLYEPSDKLIVKSENCYQYDSEGKQYIDFESGVWCVNVGHSNERIIKVIEKQIKESIHHGYRFRNKHSEELSKEIQRIIGYKNGASVFLSSGSEAVNLAATIAKHVKNRKNILKIDNSYLSAFGQCQISSNNYSLVNIRFNDLSSLSDIDFRSISAVFVETGGASIGMVQIPNYDFIKQLVEEAKRNKCLVIADEVTTGFGRLGKWFGFQKYDIIPDIVIMGKALGNGYPISSVTVSSEVAENFEQNPFRYAQSHQNDPLGCAIGLEVINIIEENNLVDKCNSSGDYFMSQLQVIKKRHAEKIKEIRGSGLMLALEFQDDYDGSLINNDLFKNGFVIGFKNNTLRFLPPLTIEKSDIDKLSEKIDVLLSD